MQQLMKMSNTNNEVTMTSLEIAELTGKEHGHVMRDIRNMFKELEKDESIFGSIYKDAYNRDKPCFKLDKLHTETLILGYSAKLRLAVLVRIKELEQQLASPQMPDFNNPLAAARAWVQAEEGRQLAVMQLEADKPKVKFVDDYVDTNGLFTFRAVAKIIKTTERDFRKFITDNDIMYKLTGDWVPKAQHLNAGRMVTKTGTAMNGHSYTQSYFTPKGVEWIAGIYAQSLVTKELLSHETTTR